MSTALALNAQDIRHWNTGGCSTLAHYIHHMTGWPLMGTADAAERADHGHADFPFFDHVFVAHPSGLALDARGLHAMPGHAEPITPEHLNDLHDAEAFRGWPAGKGCEIHPDYADAPAVARLLVESCSAEADA